MIKDSFSRNLFHFISEMNILEQKKFQYLEDKDINNMQYSILEYLYFSPNASLKDLCNHMKINTSNGSREVRKLEYNHYLLKEQNMKDRRFVTLSLSKRGKRLVDETYFEFMQEITIKYNQLTENEQFNLVECMKYITDKLI